jgi:hypothetical protein
MDALDGMGLLINNFNGEQHRIMAEMHQELQLLISLFIISVHPNEHIPFTHPTGTCSLAQTRACARACARVLGMLVTMMLS